jgi:hypothetical protein
MAEKIGLLATAETTKLGSCLSSFAGLMAVQISPYAHCEQEVMPMI